MGDEHWTTPRCPIRVIVYVEGGVVSGIATSLATPGAVLAKVRDLDDDEVNGIDTDKADAEDAEWLGGLNKEAVTWIY